MPTRRSIAVAVSLLAPFALARCDCADPLQGLPVAQIEILDDAGNSHKTADPWLVVNFGDADSGQTQTRNAHAQEHRHRAAHRDERVRRQRARPRHREDRAVHHRAERAVHVRPRRRHRDRSRSARGADMVIRFAPLAGGPAAFFLQVTSDAVDEPVVAVQLDRPRHRRPPVRRAERLVRLRRRRPSAPRSPASSPCATAA